jgi:hypothetical protein
MHDTVVCRSRSSVHDRAAKPHAFDANVHPVALFQTVPKKILSTNAAKARTIKAHTHATRC